ncbi:Cellulose synthase-like protein H1 [Acorus calamus]|uniref:Cellulose synthase-like protein H1 n=1 Tax=Acorus calamus TaxID=4465 RepID=A0AAV9FA35_ACOCL|nr:Cellulose synthase-like protein H1 [Acorus calamus]
MMKKEYEELRQRIEQKINDFASFQCEEDAKDFSGIEVRNHPSIIKVIWENKQAGPDGIPHLIYVAREKSPNHPYHYKAGAMNVLTRVSAVMTNAPFMLNLDCDMFANNSKIMLHAMCLMLGFDNEVQSGFVQCPQQFHGALKDDPFGNQVVVLQQYVICGIAGIQGPPYGGTGCFHRRKVIYGVSPGHGDPEKITKETFGHSRELMESATQIIKGTTKKDVGIYDLSSSLKAAKNVARSDYEFDTSWGKEMGWLYGSTAEDINTGVRIHANGWGSVRCTPDPPGFLGNAPVGGPESMTQLKRWATGLFEIIVGHNSPLIAVVTKKLRLRQCLAYMVINLWAPRSLPELCYALLPACCVLSDVAFLPKGQMVMVPISLFMIYNAHTLMEYLHCGLSPRAWWNNQRMQRVTSATAWLFGLLGVVLKLLGISETIFEITRKDRTISDEEEIDGDAGRFTFDSSPLFVPATSIVLVNLVAIGVGLFRGGEGVGLGEVACCAWVVLCFWAFVRGMFGKGRYGIPWSTIGKAGVLCSLVLGLCMLG